MTFVGAALRSRALCAVVMSLAGLGAGAATADAAAPTVAITNPGADETLTFTGTAPAGDAPQFKFIAPGTTQIFSSVGFSGTIPASCTQVDPHTLQCDDAGTGGHTINHLVINTGAGPDAPLIDDECFPTVVMDLGGGDNTAGAAGANCSGGTETVTTGSGNDTFNQHDASLVAATVNLGPGDDQAKGGGGPLTADGGPGKDFLDGSLVGDTLVGGPGDDNLFGRDGADTLGGGDGDDQFDFRGLTTDTDLGADDYTGGAGTDSVHLDGHGAGMNISLNDVADDGASGEGDNFHSDLENILGTPKDDTYTGTAAADTFDGNQGNDTIHGAGGDDALSGGSGNDAVFGDEGNDSAYGDYGDDTVDGGAGHDSLFGDLAGCSIGFSCPTGNDTLRARDGESDAVNCGLGADSAQVDAGVDVVSTDPLTACESIDAGDVSPGHPGGPGLGNPGGASKPFTSAITGKASSRTGVPVTVNCTVACTFTVALSIGKSTARAHGLGKKAVTIGTAKGTLLGSGGTAVKVKLTKKARAKLGTLRRFKATLTITVSTATGTPTSTVTAVTVKR